jgi:hypothetical protein
MRYTVIQTFHTPQQRFHKGAEIEDNAIEGPLSAERWVELGKLAPVNGDGAPEMPAVEEPAADPVVADDPSSE